MSVHTAVNLLSTVHPKFPQPLLQQFVSSETQSLSGEFFCLVFFYSAKV